MATMTACPTCGHKPRAPKATMAAAIATAAMSDTELFAHLKRIGPRDDARFFLKYGPPMPDNLRAEAAALLAVLETRPAKPADVRLLFNIKDRVWALRPWPTAPAVDVAA